MTGTTAPIQANGLTKYQLRTRREKALGRNPCPFPCCDFHGAAPATLQRHINVSNLNERWACLTCGRSWCNSRACSAHTCEPPGHNPLLGPAQDHPVRFDMRNPGNTLTAAEFQTVYNLFPGLFLPLGPAAPPAPAHPGLGVFPAPGPLPPPVRPQLPPVIVTFQLSVAGSQGLPIVPQQQQVATPHQQFVLGGGVNNNRFFNHQPIVTQHLHPPMQQQVAPPHHQVMLGGGANSNAYFFNNAPNVLPSTVAPGSGSQRLTAGMQSHPPSALPSSDQQQTASVSPVDSGMPAWMEDEEWMSHDESEVNMQEWYSNVAHENIDPSL